MIRLDLNPDGWAFPGTTNWDDGRGIQSIALSSYDFIASDDSIQRLEHDLIIYEDIIIKQGSTLLTPEVDYLIGLVSECESDYVTAIQGSIKRVANGIKIINVAYHGVTLTATGFYAGDTETMRRINETDDRITAIESGYKPLTTGATDTTINLDILNEGEHHYQKIDAGSGKVKFSGTTRNLINGRVVADWELNGQWTEIKLKVVGSSVYAVGDTLICNYMSSNLTVEKTSSQKMDIYGEITISYNSSSQVAFVVNLPESFSNVYYAPNAVFAGSVYSSQAIGRIDLITINSFRIVSSDNATTTSTDPTTISAKGKW